MKIRGRYIGILAVLGLLIALLPLAPAGAAVGDLTIIGGADDEGAFFSDKIGFNVLEIAVEDSDLSPARVGKARYDSFSGRSVNLEAGVVAGDLKMTEKLDGGLKNPVCIDSEADEATADGHGTMDMPYSGPEADRPDECAPQGDVVQDDPDTTGYIDDPGTSDVDETDDITYTVTLKETLRDANDDGALMEADDVTVTLDNDELDVDVDFNLGGAANDDGLGSIQ